MKVLYFYVVLVVLASLHCKSSPAPLNNNNNNINNSGNKSSTSLRRHRRDGRATSGGGAGASSSAVVKQPETRDVEEAVPPCGKEIRNRYGGYIESPGYPVAYPANSNCVWTIHVRRGEEVLLTIIDIDLENNLQSQHCSHDYLLVDNLRGDDDFYGKRICTETNQQLKSKGNRIKITFRSDSSTQRPGFRIGFDVVDEFTGERLDYSKATTSTAETALRTTTTTPYGPTTTTGWTTTTRPATSRAAATTQRTTTTTATTTTTPATAEQTTTTRGHQRTTTLRGGNLNEQNIEDGGGGGGGGRDRIRPVLTRHMSKAA